MESEPSAGTEAGGPSASHLASTLVSLLRTSCGGAVGTTERHGTVAADLEAALHGQELPSDSSDDDDGDGDEIDLEEILCSEPERAAEDMEDPPPAAEDVPVHDEFCIDYDEDAPAEPDAEDSLPTTEPSSSPSSSTCPESSPPAARKQTAADLDSATMHPQAWAECMKSTFQDQDPRAIYFLDHTKEDQWAVYCKDMLDHSETTPASYVGVTTLHPNPVDDPNWHSIGESAGCKVIMAADGFTPRNVPYTRFTVRIAVAGMEDFSQKPSSNVTFLMYRGNTQSHVALLQQQR
jgi:hypothetical protein